MEDGIGERGGQRSFIQSPDRVSGQRGQLYWVSRYGQSAASCTELFGTVNAVIFVPFRSVGKDSGILPAVRADRMETEKEGQKKIIEKPYIAISEEKLSQNDSYQILLNEKLWV